MLGSNPSKPSLLLSSTSCLQIYQTRPRGTVLHRKMLDLNYSETYKGKFYLPKLELPNRNDSKMSPIPLFQIAP